MNATITKQAMLYLSLAIFLICNAMAASVSHIEEHQTTTLIPFENTLELIP